MLRILLSIQLFVSITWAQQFQLDEKAFFTNMQTSYYAIGNTELENMTCLVTNSSMEEFAKENWQNAEIFPLQFIWIKPDRIFLSQQGVPNLDEAKNSLFYENFDDLKQQVKAIILDLQRFYISGIYSSISDDYILVKKKQVIQILFETVEDSLLTQFDYTFGINGLCLKIETFYPDQNRKIVTYPLFKIVKTKWLCTGWEVQIMQDDQVVSGFAVKLENRIVDNYWVPAEIRLEVQKIEEVGKTYGDVLKFKNFLFNQPLQLIDKTSTDR